MRNPERIDRMLDKLKTLWHDNADMRLGQLILNLTRLENGSTSTDRAFNIEDDDLELELDDTLKGGWA